MENQISNSDSELIILNDENFYIWLDEFKEGDICNYFRKGKNEFTPQIKDVSKFLKTPEFKTDLMNLLPSYFVNQVGYILKVFYDTICPIFPPFATLLHDYFMVEPYLLLAQDSRDHIIHPAKTAFVGFKICDDTGLWDTLKNNWIKAINSDEMHKHNRELLSFLSLEEKNIKDENYFKFVFFLSAILHDIGYAITHVHGVTKNLSIKRDFLGTLHEELCVCRNNDKNFYKKSFICDEHWEIITRLESENKLFSNKHHGYCSFLIINLLIENMFNNYEGWVHHDKNSSIQANKIIFAFNIAAQASLYHTLIKHKYYTNRINSEDKRFPQIDVFSDPISSLLILSDEIQEWGRIGKSQKITQKNGKVLINYCIEDIKKDQILINKKVEGNKTLLDFNLNSEKSSAQDACLNLAETRKSGYKLIEQLKANNYFDIQCNKI